MKKSISLTFLLLGCASGVLGQSVEFLNSQSQLRDQPNSIPWVNHNGNPTFMWETVESGTGAADSVNGLNSLSFGGFVAADFTWKIGQAIAGGGNLELSSSLSPGPASIGFERYTNVNGATAEIQFSYSGDLWATGTVDFIRSEVANINSATATGTGQVTLTSAGVDSTFFDEVMTLSGNSGLLAFEFDNFQAVDAAGLFSSDGRFTVVPEPSEYALMFGVLGVAAVAYRRRRLAASQLA